VPVISIEGFRGDTDARRGEGTYDRFLSAASRLEERRVSFGCSITATRKNIDGVTDRGFVRQVIEAGVRAFVYVEYVPIDPGTEDLVLNDNQRATLKERLVAFDRDYPALFIGFPGDEAAYGGCLAASRGFVHVSPSGAVEPCPAAPFSDTDLTKTPLKDALCSGLLHDIRLHHERLTEAHGGCALWGNREWVQGLMDAREKAP
jgi:MoaA/NifB/PqqE/SkfB family radical SAM enzyme